MVIEPRILNCPWSTQASRELIASVGDRPLILFPAGTERVRTSVRGIDLPRVATYHLDGASWQAFELLGTGRTCGGSEEFELCIPGAKDQYRVRLDDGHVLSLSPDLEAGASPAGESIQGFLGGHVDLVYSPLEQPNVRLRDGCASLRVEEFLAKWNEITTDGDARISLIVRIAQEVSAIVHSIGESPRRVLRRRRSMERVGAVRQIDPAGVRWLVRQPGRTLAERAGPRQRLLAVVREESFETHENRVMRDFLDRCASEMRIWLRENRGYQTSGRFQAVARYASMARMLRRVGPLAELQPVHGAVEPNYVLQHDERYSVVWPWYLKLRQRQEEEDRLWRWSHRTFAESVRLALAQVLEDIEAEDPLPEGVGFRRQILLRHEQNYGTFVDERTQLAAWLARGRAKNRIALSILTAEQVGLFEAAAGRSGRLGSMRPDALVIAHDPFDTHKVYSGLAVWARLRFSEGGPSEASLLELGSTLKGCGTRLDLTGMVVEAMHGQGQGSSLASASLAIERTEVSAPVYVVMSPLPALAGRAALRGVVYRALLGREQR